LPDPLRLSDEIASAIARCLGAARLREVRLDMGPLTRTGAAALAKSRRLECLQLLDVDVAQGDEEACRILEGRFGNRVSLHWESRTY
jgi:hypothetical protein